MRTTGIAFLVGTLIAASFINCSKDEDEAVGGQGGAQGGSGGSGAQGGTGGAGGDGGGCSATGGSYGFDLRVPQSREVDCGDPIGVTTFQDADWLCTFDHGGQEGVIYVQSTPVGCQITMSAIAVYETQLAQLSDGCSLQPLTNAQYYWGGNHQNDYLEFDYGGYEYKYYHSSFSTPGWRKCQPMDCMQVSQENQMTEDGCTEERTLPVVCVPIEEDGTYDPLIDTFEPCEQY